MVRDDDQGRPAGDAEPHRRTEGAVDPVGLLPSATRASHVDPDVARHGRRRRARGPLGLRRALGKRELRVAAVEDGPFTRRHRYAGLVAVVVVAPHRLEAVATGRLTVDGVDANERIAGLLEATGQIDGIRAVVLDGISYGGFNLVDLPALARRLRRPVIAVTAERPDRPAIRAAIRKYFPRDASRRLARVDRSRVRPVRTSRGVLYAAAAGTTWETVRPLLQRLVVRGRWPEPLTMAHRIARAMARPVPSVPKDYGPGRRPRRGPVA